MSDCGLVEFSITDGTVAIDLLASNRNRAGYGLQRYTPGRPQLKDGGIWQDSPLAVGRQLVFGIDTNTADAITLICGGNDQDFIIRAYEELDKLLKKAHAYWTTTWQQTPVYLRARAKGETARRYALIHYGKFDEYFDPYGELFAGNGFKVCTEEFVLGVERGLWLDDVPGEYTAVAISNANSGAAQTGYEYSTAEGVVIGNMHNGPGLTHVYQFTASGSVFSANRLDGSPPYTLLGATQAVGNILYLGADLPFYGVKFQLSTLAGTSTVTWEYWNGSAWTVIAVGPFTFQSATPEHVQISAAAVNNWAKTTINSRNKYWLRARVTAVTGTTSPVQGTRHVYATTSNYIEVAEDEIEGTADALLRAAMTIDLIGTTAPFTSIIALRSYDRGPDFQSHINVGAGNPTGFSYTVGGSAGITENTAAGNSPGGATVAASNTGGSGTMVNVVDFNFAGTALPSFFGRFRLFARISTTSAALSQIQYTLRPSSTLGNDAFVVGEIKLVDTGTTPYVPVDLGYITLPPADFMLHSDDYDGFRLTIRMAVPSGETLTLFGIILMPSDEWISEITGSASVPIAQSYRTHIIDGISFPKHPRRALFTNGEPNGTVLASMLAVANGVPILHANARQRYWFMIYHAAISVAEPGNIVGVKLNKSQRNLSLRSET